MLFQNAISASAATLHPDTVARAGDPVRAFRSGVECRALDRKWRFHNEVQNAVGPDEQREILIISVLGAASDIEDPLRVFEEGIHANHLSAGMASF